MRIRRQRMGRVREDRRHMVRRRLEGRCLRSVALGNIRGTNSRLRPRHHRLLAITGTRGERGLGTGIEDASRRGREATREREARTRRTRIRRTVDTFTHILTRTLFRDLVQALLRLCQRIRTMDLHHQVPPIRCRAAIQMRARHPRPCLRLRTRLARSTRARVRDTFKSARRSRALELDRTGAGEDTGSTRARRQG